MSKINVGKASVKGIGVVSKSPMERLAEEDETIAVPQTVIIEEDYGPATTEEERKSALLDVQDDDVVIEKAVNEEVPAVDVVIEKHAIGESIIEEPEGMVEKRTMEGPEFIQLKKSNKAGFNPNTTVNVLHSKDDNEGGVMANKMAMEQEAEGSQFFEIGTNKIDEESVGKYEVTGFMIQYMPAGSKGIASERVRDYYKTKEEAYSRFDGDTYLKPDGVKAKISTGAPVLCFDERQIDERINDEWRVRKS